jgi:RhtB (resistance to homoserine/threonine) family protein
MYGIVNFEAFLLTGILLNITPGNDTIFILSKSIGNGKRAGIASALGISIGSIIHTIMAALGLSLVVAKSILLFNIIKYAGAAYLIFMGYKMLLDKNNLNTQITELDKKINYYNILRDGIITNVLNPKVALFFIAFLPQFINVNQQNTVVPFLILGFTFICTGTIWCIFLALCASVILRKLTKNTKISVFINKLCGMALIMLGIKVAFTKR